MSRIIGCHEAGNPCNRYLWLKFRNAFIQKVSPELQQIFDDGFKIEAEIIKKLKESGKCITDHDTTGKQIFVKSSESLFIGGYVDGLIEDQELMVLEIKSANNKNYQSISKYGMIKANPVYHTQLNLYLGFTKLKHGLWIVKNKETDEIYEEILNFNAEKFEKDFERCKKIIDESDVSEPTISYHCIYCGAKELCKGNCLPEISCKICKFYQISNEIEGKCSKYPYEKCETPCESFCYTEKVFKLAGFNFEDEDIYYNVDSQRIEDCIILLRDDFGKEYPIRGLEDCEELKLKMEQGFRPKSRLMP